ncbi:RNA methyltransferase [Clostridium oceanicum]
MIKLLRKLKEKKYRVKEKKFLIEGFRFVEEALKSKSEIESIFVLEKSLDKFKNLCTRYNINNNNCYVVSEGAFKSISDTKNPQGIIAIVKNKKIALSENKGFYILADKVKDPGNMGTIIRTAHAAGALGVIITKGTVDVYNEKTLRSTMGSIFYVPIIEDYSLKVLEELRETGFKLLVSSLDTKNNFYDVDLTGNLIVSVGNEGNGISDDILSLGDFKVKIPMPGNAESLNVAVACSIMTFERVRQINTLKFN